MANIIRRVGGKLKKVSRKVQKKFNSKGLILMYHSIGEEASDAWSLRVRPKHFEEHMEVFKKLGHPLSLSELYKSFQAGKVPDRSITITFDDGYFNNLQLGKPILEKYDVPATVFVTTSFVEHGLSYWWDELEYALMRPGQLPDQLTLRLNGNEHHWDLNGAAEFTEDQAKKENLPHPWFAEEGTRSHFHLSVWAALQDYLPDEQRALVKQVIDWAGISARELKDSYRPMTPEELHILEKDNLVSIGAHTVHHPMLERHSAEIQRREILQSKEYLESVLNHPVKHFAYPFGNYNDDTEGILEKGGFDCACSAQGEAVWKKSDRFFLPRMEATDLSGEEMEQTLETWFNC